MTFDRRHERGTLNWLNAGNLGGYTTRALYPVNSSKSDNIDTTETTFSAFDFVLDAKLVSKFLTLNDVC